MKGVRTSDEPPKRLLRVQPPRERPFRLCSHSSRCWRFISASFFAYSMGMFFHSYAFRMGLTSGVLKMAIAGSRQLVSRTSKGGHPLTLQERNHRDKATIFRVSCPFGHDYRILRVGRHMLRMGVEEDNFRQVAIEVRQVLAYHISCD